MLTDGADGFVAVLDHSYLELITFYAMKQWAHPKDGTGQVTSDWDT